MSYFFTSIPFGTLNGSAQNDIIWDSANSGTTTINGNNGNDVLYGDSTRYQGEGSSRFNTAPNLTSQALWTTFENPDVTPLVDSSGTEAPYAAIRVPAVSSGRDYNFYRLDVQAGQTIQIDVDYGEFFTGSPAATSSDMQLWLFRGNDSTSNLVRAVDNIFPPDARGSILDSAGTNNDPMIRPFTFDTGGTYYLRVGEVGSSRFDGGEQYMMYVSLTGQSENGTGGIRANADLMFGGNGDDTMYGQGGNDTLNGGNDKDYLDGGTGNDTLNGNAGQDTLMGDKGRDLLYGGGANDWIEGGDGRDNLKGGIGSDWLFGGEGIDNLKGDSGNPASARAGDFLFGGAGGTSRTNADKLDGNEGNDIIYGDGLDNVSLVQSLSLAQLREGFGNDNAVGGIDIMTGGGGDDFIFGGGGSYDRLNGGNGSDTMVGGGGKDGFRFVNEGSINHFRPGDHDRIRDFNIGTDVLELKGTLPDFDSLTFTNQNGNLRVDFANGYRITFDGLGSAADVLSQNLSQFDQFYEVF